MRCVACRRAGVSGMLGCWCNDRISPRLPDHLSTPVWAHASSPYRLRRPRLCASSLSTPARVATDIRLHGGTMATTACELSAAALAPGRRTRCHRRRAAARTQGVAGAGFLSSSKQSCDRVGTRRPPGAGLIRRHHQPKHLPSATYDSSDAAAAGPDASFDDPSDVLGTLAVGATVVGAYSRSHL